MLFRIIGSRERVSIPGAHKQPFQNKHWSASKSAVFTLKARRLPRRSCPDVTHVCSCRSERRRGFWSAPARARSPRSTPFPPAGTWSQSPSRRSSRWWSTPDPVYTPRSPAWSSPRSASLYCSRLYRRTAGVRPLSERKASSSTAAEVHYSASPDSHPSWLYTGSFWIIVGVKPKTIVN